eukprot:7413794-Pyramimonas_sp.AAC.1
MLLQTSWRASRWGVPEETAWGVLMCMAKKSHLRPGARCARGHGPPRDARPAPAMGDARGR